jgi:hypothetical protein
MWQIAMETREWRKGSIIGTAIDLSSELLYKNIHVACGPTFSHSWGFWQNIGNTIIHYALKKVVYPIQHVGPDLDE